MNVYYSISAFSLYFYPSSLYFFAAILRPFACRSFILTGPRYSPRLFMVIPPFARTQLKLITISDYFNLYNIT